MGMRCLPFSAVLLVGFAVASASAQTPPACVTKTADGGLKAGSGGGTIVTDKKEFYDSAKVFPVETFSDQAPTGTTAEFCLRYEIENIGPETIHNFFWGLPGIFVKDFRPGTADRQSRSKHVLSIKDPEVQPTTINAFVNESATPKVWVVENLVAEATPGSQFADVVAVNRDSFLPPDVQFALEANSIPRSQYPLLTVNLGDGKPIYPVLETVSGEGFDLEVNSRVTRDGDSVRFQTDVSLSGDGAKDARIAMPALQALEGVEAAGSPDYYDSYLASVEKQGSEMVSGFTKRRFSATIGRKNLLRDSLFLSDQVIKVQANGNEYCYRFQSYTPFAVDFDLDRCR